MKLNTETLKKLQQQCLKMDRKTKSYLTVVGSSMIYFAMGLYFAAGNTGVYLTSYLIYRSKSDMKLDDAIWFLSAAGFSALLLPAGGWLGARVGVRAVCLLGGLLQSCGIFATYWALDTTFILVVIVYGGSFLVSLATCYTSPMVNVCKWHPRHKGLVTGLGAASMAVAPTLFTPLITSFVNPNNLPANPLGLFDDPMVLDRTKRSTIIQGVITLSLFLIGVILTFPAEPEDDDQLDHSPDRRRKRGVIESVTDRKVALTKFNCINNFESKAEQQTNSDHHNHLARPDNGSYQTTDTRQYSSGWSVEELIKDRTSLSIEPKYAFKTSEFWLLSLKVLISELIFIYLLFMYKPYGQTFIQDDYFLSAVGAACAISNTVGRLSMGYIKDKLGYRAVSIPLSGLTMMAISLMPATRYFNKYFYGAAVVMAVGGVGSQYGLTPSAAQDSFGDKYAGINIGYVYMSTVIATISSALLSQNLTSFVGWEGMIFLMAGFSALDFVSTFFMPSNPAKRLVERYRQFYLAG